MRVLILAVAASLASCGPRALEPEPIRVDGVHCATCGMMISRVRDTAQAVFPDEDTRFYDDVGCLARDAAALRRGARLFARAADDTGWIAVDQAWFASPTGLQTPMGYGLAVFAEARLAHEADRGGRARRWAEVLPPQEARR